MLRAPGGDMLQARAPTAIALLVGVALEAPSAWAGEPAPPITSLSWVRLSGAETCAGAREVAGAVEKRLGRAVFVAPSRAEAAVEARIERVRVGGWRATLILSDDRGNVRGTRELKSDAPSCRALDDAIALALALMIDPDADLSTPPPSPPAPPTAPPPPEPPPPPRCEPAPTPPPSPPVAPPSTPAAPTPRPPPARPWRFGAQPGLTAGLGLLPRAGAGVAVRFHAIPPRGPAFEVGGTVWIEQTVALPAGRGATFDLAYASISVCPLALDVARTTFFACGGIQVGSLRANAFGFDNDVEQDQLVFNFTAEAHVRRALVGPLFAAVGLGVVVPVVRDRFDAFSTQDSLFRMSPVAGTVETAIGVAFP